MLHTCVRIFDVTGTVKNFLETKQGLIMLASWFGSAGLRSERKPELGLAFPAREPMPLVIAHAMESCMRYPHPIVCHLNKIHSVSTCSFDRRRKSRDDTSDDALGRGGWHPGREAAQGDE